MIDGQKLAIMCFLSHLGWRKFSLVFSHQKSYPFHNHGFRWRDEALGLYMEIGQVFHSVDCCRGTFLWYNYSLVGMKLTC